MKPRFNCLKEYLEYTMVKFWTITHKRNPDYMFKTCNQKAERMTRYIKQNFRKEVDLG